MMTLVLTLVMTLVTTPVMRGALPLVDASLRGAPVGTLLLLGLLP